MAMSGCSLARVGSFLKVSLYGRQRKPPRNIEKAILTDTTMRELENQGNLNQLSIWRGYVEKI